jgi:hypothetical protein
MSAISYQELTDEDHYSRCREFCDVISAGDHQNHIPRFENDTLNTVDGIGRIKSR